MIQHGEAHAKQLLDEIDRRYVPAQYLLLFVGGMSLREDIPSIAATPYFPGLRNFYEGREFKQWTGDDSKALMKVRGLPLNCVITLIRYAGLPARHLWHSS